MSIATKFAPANDEGQVKVIARASEDAQFSAEHDVTNFRFPISRSWTNESGQFDDNTQKTSWWKAAAWKNAASRAAEIKKGDILIVDFHLADVVAEAFTRNNGEPGAGLKIERCRVRVINPLGHETSFEAEAVQAEAEPAEIAL